MKTLKTAILILCLMAGACLTGTGPRAFAERITEPKAPVGTPAAEETVSPEEETLPPVEDGDSEKTNTEETAASSNVYEAADDLPSEEEARATRMRKARPFLVGFGIVNVLILVFAILLDRVPGLAAGLAGRMKLEVKVPSGNMVRSLQQLEEWKKSGMISEGEFLRLKRQYSAAHRGRRGAGR